MSISQTRRRGTGKSDQGGQSGENASPASLVEPLLVQGVKHKRAIYRTLVGAAPFLWPVARLEGGQHGPYDLAKALPKARGTYGKLRLSLDPQGQAVAVKALRLRAKRGALTCPMRPESLRAELQAMAAAGPEHVPRDVIQAHHKVYIVMPLADGDLFTLRGALLGSQAGPARKQVARHMLAQAVPMLARLHAQGWVHFDIKLENFLWSRDGTLRLTDFGLASDDSRKVNPRGTLYTMAPEVARGLPRDGRADVWSLGVTLCEMLVPSSHLFITLPMARGKALVQRSVARVRLNQHVFRGWRNALPRLANGDINLLSLNARLPRDPLRRRFVEHFRAVRDADWALCQLILTHMLVVNVSKRASIETIEQVAESRLGSQPAREELGRLLQTAPCSASRRSVLQVLRDVRSGAAIRI